MCERGEQAEALRPAARKMTRAALSAEARKALDGQLWDAAMKGDAAAIERLAAEGASPNAKNEYGEPAVWKAAYRGHAGAVSALVRLGGDLDATDSDGRTALMGAAWMGQVECVRALLAGGADRTLRATGGRAKGKPALEIAEQVGYAEVAALLLADAAALLSRQPLQLGPVVGVV